MKQEDAFRGLYDELRRMGVENYEVIISTDLPVRNADGMPYAKARAVDPGTAVYFRLKGLPHVLACDSYDSVRANVRAICLTIGATRALGRYGVVSLEQAFSGYRLLPAPGGDWRAVLGLLSSDNLAAAEAAFRRLSMQAHPDRGGSQERQAQLNAAIAAARKELGQ
ncbi:MAG: J domain-containing protein [Thermodesulfobacteriota bacterium]